MHNCDMNDVAMQCPDHTRTEEVLIQNVQHITRVNSNITPGKAYY